MLLRRGISCRPLKCGLMSSMVQTDGKALPSQTTQPQSAWASVLSAVEHVSSTAHGDFPRFAPLFVVSAIMLLALLTALAATGAIALPVLGAGIAFVGLAYSFVVCRGRALMGALASTLVMTAVLAWMTAQTGGLWSPVALLFVVAPIEASLTRDARAVRWVFLSTILGLIAGLLGGLTVTAATDVSEIMLFVLLAGVCTYGVGLTLRVVRSSTLRDVQARATHRAIDQFHAITHDMFLIVGRDGCVHEAFGAVEAILGCPSADLSGHGLLKRLHVADRPSVLSTLDRVQADMARDTVEARLRVGSCGGSQRFLWVEIDLSAVRGSDGATEIYALVRDIHATKDHEAELTRAREKAEASDEAKGRFLASMSHELRTPLNAIIGFADILDEEVFGALANEQQREYVGLIRESGSHLLQLVNDLLDMSKLDAGHFQIVAEPFILRTVIDRSLKLMQCQIDKAGLTLKLDIPDRLPELVADQRAVRQIVINLLSNACKFTETGGTIIVRVRQDHDRIIVSVIDNGIGIAPQDVKRLGEPFFQANSSYDRHHQGTGLGLSVVKGLCELHEGRLSISSVEGEGTTVSILLPLNGPQAARAGNVTGTPTEKANAVVLAKLEKERSSGGRPIEDAVLSQSGAAVTDEEGVELQERKRAHG